ncbi:hypothetical protein F5148DRAFT_1349109 [Russula earlei]|uniref:Uncharacterized protein n=1 Tax=Russula earlei TaxID=71964 RepID=A0ACC0TSI3_9AGAM|nr:hypothetical protein F5148DRAFT_1349109 [Russula earlei]
MYLKNGARNFYKRKRKHNPSRCTRHRDMCEAWYHQGREGAECVHTGVLRCYVLFQSIEWIYPHEDGTLYLLNLMMPVWPTGLSLFLHNDLLDATTVTICAWQKRLMPSNSQLIRKEKSVPLPRTEQIIIFPRNVNITPATMLGLSIRGELYDGNKFGIEPGFASASEKHANTSDLMTRHVTESSDARQESVVVKEGNSRRNSTWASWALRICQKYSAGWLLEIRRDRVCPKLPAEEFFDAAGP